MANKKATEEKYETYEFPDDKEYKNYTPLENISATEDKGLDRPDLANIYSSLPQGLQGIYSDNVNQGWIPREVKAQTVGYGVPQVAAQQGQQGSPNNPLIVRGVDDTNPANSVEPIPSYNPNQRLQLSNIAPPAPQTAQQQINNSPITMTPQQFSRGELQRKEEQKGEVQTQAALDLARDTDVNAINQRGIDENNRRLQEQEARWNQVRSDVDTRDEAIRKRIQETSAMQIDPDRLWNSRSTAQKILAGVGMFLGALGGGIGKTGVNPAMEVINNAISHDIDAQKSHIDNSWKGISATHQLDNDAFNREMHNQVWRNTFRTAALEQVKKDVEQRGALSKSIEVQNNAVAAVKNINKNRTKSSSITINLEHKHKRLNKRSLKILAKKLQAII